MICSIDRCGWYAWAFTGSKNGCERGQG